MFVIQRVLESEGSFTLLDKNKVIKQNSDQVEQLKAGKTKILGFLVGQVMKETSGKANPQKVNDLIHAILRL